MEISFLIFIYSIDGYTPVATNKQTEALIEPLSVSYSLNRRLLPFFLFLIQSLFRFLSLSVSAYFTFFLFLFFHILNVSVLLCLTLLFFSCFVSLNVIGIICKYVLMFCFA